MFKKLFTGAVIAMSAVCVSIPAYASTVNITDDISVGTLKNIKKLTRRTTSYVGYQISYNLKYKQSKSLNFSDASARKQVIRISYMDSGNYKKSQKSISKDLFGRSTPKVKPLIGDWGEIGPYLDHYKVYRDSNGNYIVTVKEVPVTGIENYPDIVEGTARYTLKKKSSAKYGFVLKKLKVTRTIKKWPEVY